MSSSLGAGGAATPGLELVTLGQGRAQCTLLRYRGVHILLDCAAVPDSGLLLQQHLQGSERQQHRRLHDNSDHHKQQQSQMQQSEDEQNQDQQEQHQHQHQQGHHYSTAPEPLLLGPLLELTKLYPIDAILITTPEALLGLPLLTACHPDAERWSVYCTLAALDVAKHLAAELCDIARRVKATAVAPGPRRQGQGRDQGQGQQGQQGQGQEGQGQQGQVQAQGQRQGQQGQGSSAALATPTPAGAGWKLPQPQEVGWRLPPGCEPRLFDACWHRPYDAQQAAACFARVTGVRYGQHLSLDGMYLGAVAYPSGSGLGHALWVVSDGTFRIGYASRLCLQPGHSLEFESGTVSNLTALISAPGACQQQHAAARTTSTQPPRQAAAQAQPQASVGAPWPVQSPAQAQGQAALGAPLAQPLVWAPWPTQAPAQAPVQGQTQAPVGAPWPMQAPAQAPAWPPRCEGVAGGGGVAVVMPEHPIAPPASGGVSVCPGAAEACQEVAATLRAGGSALIGVAASGAAWPLIELLVQQLDQYGLQHCPLLYVSPAAKGSLALACTSSEFLSRSRQVRGSEEAGAQPSPPFPFDELLKSGRLVVTQSLADRRLHGGAWREPLVAIVSLCSLQTGPGSQLLRRWRHDPNSLLLLGLELPSSCPEAAAAHAATLLSPLELLPSRQSPQQQLGQGQGRGQGGPQAAGIRTLAVNLAPPQPSVEQLAQLLATARPRHLLAWSSDCSSLRRLPRNIRAPLAAITLTDLDWLQQVKVALPSAPSLPACGLAPAALASLDWKRSTPPHTSSAVQQGQGQEQELFLARFEGTLTLQDRSHWLLTPARGKAQPNPNPDQLDPSLLGPPSLSGLLQQLREGGFPWLDVRHVDQQRQGQQGQKQGEQQGGVSGGAGGGETLVQVLGCKVPAAIRLGGGRAVIKCDSASMRSALYKCLAAASRQEWL